MSTIQAVAAMGVMAHVHVKNHPFRPALPNPSEPSVEEADQATIRLIGVGTIGIKVAEVLARTLPGTWCHEIMNTIGAEGSTDLELLLSSVRASHLVFIVSDEYSQATAQVVGAAAVTAGVLTVAITPDVVQEAFFKTREVPEWFDVVFIVSDCSLSDQDGSVPLSPASLTEYALRHVIETITTLITRQTGVCVDYSDVVKILRSGSVGRLGIGIGSNSSRGATAAMQAIRRLTSQGVDVSSATGVIAAVHGSGDITMDDFDAASRVIHDDVSADANVLVGLVSGDLLGGNVKTTVLVVIPS